MRTITAMTATPARERGRTTWWHVAAIWLGVVAIAILASRLRSGGEKVDRSSVGMPDTTREAVRARALSAVRAHPAVDRSAHLTPGLAMPLGDDGTVLAMVFAYAPMAENPLLFSVFLKPMTAPPCDRFEVQKMLAGRRDRRTQEFIVDPEYRWPR